MTTVRERMFAELRAAGVEFDPARAVEDRDAARAERDALRSQLAEAQARLEAADRERCAAVANKEEACRHASQVLQRMGAELDDARSALLASQARETQLREALEMVRDTISWQSAAIIRPGITQPGRVRPAAPCWKLREAVDAALSAPPGKPAETREPPLCVAIDGEPCAKCRTAPAETREETATKPAIEEDGHIRECGNGGDNWEDCSPECVAARVTCTTCNDTHRMMLGEDREVMCTACPRPCQRCRQGGNGPYCETTPCACACHAAPGKAEEPGAKCDARGLVTPCERAKGHTGYHGSERGGLWRDSAESLSAKEPKP